MEKWYERFNDAGFTLYNESGEATCVHIVRDQAHDIDTTGKWIDVISYNRYATDLNRFGFNWIIVELFPRIIHPQYTNDTEYNKYICWNAAHNDIATHGEKNHHGAKYIILCKLVKIVETDKPEHIKSDHGETDEPKNHIRIKYDYEVMEFSKIKQKKIDYIISNAAELVEKIRQNKKDPTLSILTVR